MFIAMDKAMLLKELENIPEPAIAEVLDYVRYVKAKAIRDISLTASASEQSLAKDWLKSEEDDAWADL